MLLVQNTGQGTLEFALIGAAFLSLVIAGGILWQTLDAGLLVEHALSSASHHVGGSVPGVVGDVFLY